MEVNAVRTVRLGGVQSHLMTAPEAVTKVTAHARNRPGWTLGVMSVNLDHMHQLRTGSLTLGDCPGVSWLNLIDGMPVVFRARALTRQPVTRVAGADLIFPLLDAAADQGLRFGVLGGSAEVQQVLRDVLSDRWPTLPVAGMWAPDRAELSNEATSRLLDETIRRAEVDVLMVCLGKPRQEYWIQGHGQSADVPVALAFGGTVDLLAGRIRRAPRIVSNTGFEWLWRLTREPKRLAARYLLQAPPAYVWMRRNSGPR